MTIPIPTAYQDLYTTLTNYLDSFSSILNGLWDGSKSQVAFSCSCLNADANVGPSLCNNINGVQLQLQEMKALGIKAVVVQMGFPMLYQPFFSSTSQYQQFVDFYTQVAASIRSFGLKLIVENNTLLVGKSQAGWDVAPFYATLNWDQYQQARAQTAVTIAQTMQPDYMVVMEEPDTEAFVTGQTQVNTVAGATQLLTQILASLEQANLSNVRFGAGVGTWLYNCVDYVNSYGVLPLDFIDMHIYPVNNDFLQNALDMATAASSLGKPIAMTEAWLWKIRDSELNVLTSDTIKSRNGFSFWEPLDSYFVQLVEGLAYYTKMLFASFSATPNMFAYLDYDAVANQTPSQLIAAETSAAGSANLLGQVSPTGLGYHNDLVIDTTKPTAPTNLKCTAISPTTVNLTWTASTDDVGVAGYSVIRNGTQLGATAQLYYKDIDLVSSVKYTYSIAAFDVAGNNSPSMSVTITAKDTTPPSPPTRLICSIVSCKQITLTWTAAVDNASSIVNYKVYRGSTKSNLVLVGNTGPNVIFYDTGLSPHTTYYYGVEAVDSAGNTSGLSVVINGTTLPLPLPPTNIAATVNGKQITLTWKQASGATYYRIFRGTAPSVLLTLSTISSQKTTYIDYTGTSNTMYYYSIETLDAFGDTSQMSAIVSAKTSN